MSIISCLIIKSLSLASRNTKRVKQTDYQRGQRRVFTEGIGSESVKHMSLITCHSSHVTHLMSHHYVIHLISHHYVTHLMSHHNVTHLMSNHYITHLMSHHYFTDTTLLPIYSRVATFYFNPWPLPISHRIILLVTSAQPLRSNLCPPHSIHPSRRIGIGSPGGSCTSQSRSHVNHLMSHH